MITTDSAVPCLIIAGTLEGIFFVGIRIFPDVLQRCNNFKGRTGRIQSLGCTVYQNGAFVILNQGIPELGIWFGSKSGWETSARIFPVLTSVTTTAPL